MLKILKKIKIYYGQKAFVHRIWGIQIGMLFIGVHYQHKEVDGWIHIKKEKTLKDIIEEAKEAFKDELKYLEDK